MAHIPPIGDAYIDEIIKAIDPYDSSLNKTQGVKLRELVKLMRDRTEQEIALSMAMQQSYTEVGDTNISVSPANYFDQPTTFIVNRNAGSDALISFESYAAAEDTGKIYHIKNVGSIPAVLVSASGALFDGETSVTLSQYSAVTIMSVNLTNGGAVSRWAIMSNKGKATVDNPVLTLVVNGLDDEYEVAVDGLVWTDNKKAFPPGTILTNVTPTIEGWILDPLSVAEVVMDSSKTLTFEATFVDDGFLPIDDETSLQEGGFIQANVIRNGNTYSLIPGASGFSLFGTDLIIRTGEVASLKSVITGYMFGVVPVSSPTHNQYNFAYGAIRAQNGQTTAIAFLNTPDSEYVNTPTSQLEPVLVEIEFTATEVIWYYGLARTEWHRTNRRSGDYYIAADVADNGRIAYFRQEGFTLHGSPSGDNLLPDFEYIDFNNAVNVGETRKVVEGPAEVWSSNSNINENPLQVPYTLQTDSVVAMGNASRGVRLGFIIGFNNLYNLIFCIRLTTAGLFQYEAYNTTTTDVSIQPTGDQFVGFRYAGSNNFEIGVIELDGTFTVANTHNMGYDVFGQSDPVVIQAKVEEQPISKIYYPQGENLVSVTPTDGLLSGNLFLNLFTKEGTAVIENDHVWSLTGPGTARAGVSKRLVAGSSVAFLYTTLSTYTNLYLRINDARDGVKIEIDGSGNVHVIFWDGLDEDLPQQPLSGQYVQLTKISDSATVNDPATFRVDIMDGNGTPVWNKVYTARYVASEETEIDFVFNVSDGYLSYPQGKNLIDI